MKTFPQCPTIASSTPAIDGLPSAASSGRSRDSVREHGDENEQTKHAKKTGYGRYSDVVSILCIPRVDAGAFDADKNEHGNEHGVANLTQHICDGRIFLAPEILREHIGIE